jgi:TonB family protein
VSCHLAATFGLATLLVAAALTAAAFPSTAVAAEQDAGAPPPARLSKPPRLTHFVEATPPASLGERGRADVILTIDVDDKGAVTTVEVAQSAGAEFDAAALAAARQFVFEPAEADGHPVAVRITYGYHFLFKPPPAPPAAPVTAPPAAPRAPAVPLSGTVLRKGDRVPVAGVAVIVDDGASRSVTGETGRFSFEALPLGAHTVKLRGPTTAPADTTVTLRPGKRPRSATRRRCGATAPSSKRSNIR